MATTCGHHIHPARLNTTKKTQYSPMSQQLPFCMSLTKIKRDTAPERLHFSHVGMHLQHHTLTHTQTQSPSSSTWPLPQLLSLVSDIGIPTDAGSAWPPKHPPRPPAQAPILQTSQCTHNIKQAGHRCPRDRHSGHSSPGTQQQQPPVQLRAENRVLFRVGGTLGMWGHKQHLQTPQQEGRGELGLTGLCQQGGCRAEPAPGLRAAHGSGIAPGTAGTWHRQRCHSGHR